MNVPIRWFLRNAGIAIVFRTRLEVTIADHFELSIQVLSEIVAIMPVIPHAFDIARSVMLVPSVVSFVVVVIVSVTRVGRSLSDIIVRTGYDACLSAMAV
jgi:hypothetical protein